MRLSSADCFVDRAWRKSPLTDPTAPGRADIRKGVGKKQKRKRECIEKTMHQGQRLFTFTMHADREKFFAHTMGPSECSSCAMGAEKSTTKHQSFSGYGCVD